MDLIENLARGFVVVFQFVDLKIAWLNITIPFPMNIDAVALAEAERHESVRPECRQAL